MHKRKSKDGEMWGHKEVAERHAENRERQRVAKNWTDGSWYWEGLSEILANSLPQVSFQEQEGCRRCF